MAMPMIDLTRGALTDAFARPIEYLRVSVTDKCNLRCVYCMPEGGLPWLQRDEILSYEEIAHIVEAAAALGVRAIRLTGGEPLLRRNLHRLVEMIARIPAIDDIALSTNGLLLEEQIDALASAGLRRVNISLDTLRADRFASIARRPGLDRVLRAVDAAIAYGLAKNTSPRRSCSNACAPSAICSPSTDHAATAPHATLHFPAQRERSA